MSKGAAWIAGIGALVSSLAAGSTWWMVYGPVIWQGSVQASSTTLWVLTADQAWEKRPSPFTAWEEAKASDDSRAAITTTLSNLAVRDVAITRVRLFADAVTGDDLHPAGTPRQINCGRIKYYFQTPDGEEVTATRTEENAGSVDY